MNSSVSSRSLLEQSLSLPGRVSRPLVAVLRETAADAARDASRARAARMMRATICSATRAVRVEPLLERRAHRAVDERLHLGVVQAVLRLALELRLGDEDAEHADDALADVLGGERHAARREVVRLDVVADRLADRAAEAVLVRAAGAGGDAVDVALERAPRSPPVHWNATSIVRAVLLLERERRVVDRLVPALGDDLLQVVDDAVLVVEGLVLAVRLVVEADLQPRWR